MEETHGSHIFNIHTFDNQIKCQMCDYIGQIKYAADKHSSVDFIGAEFGSIGKFLLI